MLLVGMIFASGNIIPKLVPSCFGLKIEYTFFVKHFVLGNVHQVTCQCIIVLSRQTFSAIAFVATVGLQA